MLNLCFPAGSAAAEVDWNTAKIAPRAICETSPASLSVRVAVSTQAFPSNTRSLPEKTLPEKTLPEKTA